MTNLKKLNASIAVLNQKLNNIHFNYKGDDFRGIHLFTEELYKIGLELYDDLSEKIVMQGEISPASFKEHLELSGIEEIEGKLFTKEEVSHIIVKDLTKIIEIANEVTSTSTIQPLLDEVFMVADKYRWIFKSII